MEEVLDTISLCLALPGAVSTGVALLEGILCSAPTKYFAAGLVVALATPDASARQAALSVLQQVPPDMLTQDILAEVMAQVSRRTLPLGSSLAPRLTPPVGHLCAAD